MSSEKEEKIHTYEKVRTCVSRKLLYNLKENKNETRHYTRRYTYGCMANTQLPYHDFYFDHTGSLL